MAAGDSIAQVILDTPLPQLDHVFEYSIPDELSERDIVGHSVKVPLRGGKRFTNAYVVSTSSQASFPGKLAVIEDLISNQPILKAETLELAQAVARRQAGTVSDVIRHIIPHRYVRTEKSFSARVTRPELSDSPIPLPEEFRNVALSNLQRYAICFPGYTSEELSSPQWVQFFARIAKENLGQGKSTIICVPDFRDIFVLEDFLKTVIPPEYLLKMDSQQPEKQRYENYLHTLTEIPFVIFGNRASVLSPAFNLGSVLVWDEADSQMVSPQAPYFNTRDVALLRQSLQSCSLIFGSYSRSLAIERLVSLGWLEELESLPVRRPHVINISDEDGIRTRIPSQAWKAAKEALSHGPVLVQVAHQGFSTALACQQCREKVVCSTCHGLLEMRQRGGQLQCKRCQKIETMWKCPHCESTQIRFLNSGTEKTAEEIGKAFPGTKIIISDSKHLVTEVPHEPAIVIATAGAEPRVLGGYQAVLLLDGYRHRLRATANADEEYLNRVATAIALSKQTSQVFLVGAGQRLGTIIALSNYRLWAQEELTDLTMLRLPPAVRSASLSGSLSSVNFALEQIRPFSPRIFGPIPTDSGLLHALVFFDYKDGDQIAAALKSAIIQTASKTRRPHTQDSPRVVELRVKLDQPGISTL